MGTKLGDELRAVRGLRELSLKAVASKAGISVAYLQKLEGGDVQSPSPKYLMGLADALDVPYASLMAAAGYLLPSEEAIAGSAVDHAFTTELLDEGERAAVAAFIKTMREMRARD
jgi:transcriptional regulator with XRE-family HTH domain